MEGLKNKIASGLNPDRKQFRFCPPQIRNRPHKMTQRSKR